MPCHVLTAVLAPACLPRCPPAVRPGNRACCDAFAAPAAPRAADVPCPGIERTNAANTFFRSSSSESELFSYTEPLFSFQLLSLLHDCIEGGRVVEFRLNLGPTQLQIVQNERLVAEQPPEKKLVRVKDVKNEWDDGKLRGQVEGFF